MTESPHQALSHFYAGKMTPEGSCPMDDHSQPLLATLGLETHAEAYDWLLGEFRTREMDWHLDEGLLNVGSPYERALSTILDFFWRKTRDDAETRAREAPAEEPAGERCGVVNEVRLRTHPLLLLTEGWMELDAETRARIAWNVRRLYGYGRFPFLRFDVGYRVFEGLVGGCADVRLLKPEYE